MGSIYAYKFNLVARSDAGAEVKTEARFLPSVFSPLAKIVAVLW